MPVTVESGHASVRGAYWRATATYALAWALSIGTLLAIALQSSTELRQRDVHGHLRVIATAIYGLSYYDAHGQYQTDWLEREPELFPTNVQAYVLEPGRRDPVFKSAVGPRPGHLGEALVTEVIESEAEVVRELATADDRVLVLLARPTYDAQDRARASIVVVADVTDGRQAHTRYITALVVGSVALLIIGSIFASWMGRRAVAPLAQSQIERERFLASAAHELRTPVAALRAEIDAALALDEPAETALERMRRLVSDSEAKVELLLARARIDGLGRPPATEPVRLDLLIESREFTNVQLDLEPAVVAADEALISIVIDNLVANARRHAPGSAIAITVRATGQLLVEDTGPGFPPEFSSASSTRAGTGLGLTLVERIVALHDGTLEIGARPGGGARVSIRLPTVPRVHR